MSPHLSLSLLLLLIVISNNVLVKCTTFTFINKCSSTVWPGILSNSGSPLLNPTGFELDPTVSRSLQAPTGWSGRFWARTGCASDASGHVSCVTGDCGSGTIECNGAGAEPPATLVEFTLSGPTSGKDFYDVSLVDGYNLAMIVEPGGGSNSGCMATGCLVDLNSRCPAELRVEGGGGCRSACEAFGKPEFCCSGDYATPATCRPSVYSEMFKMACPRSYSYAYDDATSTFTCSGVDYTITFCPDSTPSSQKASSDTPTSDTSTSGTSTPDPSSSKTKGVMLEDDSWLASLATGDAAATRRRGDFLQQALFSVVATLACTILILQVF